MRTLALISVLAGCATESSTVASQQSREPRLERLSTVLETAASSPCLKGLQQIPATVIDVGIFKNVPYQSFSNGVVELNAYGEPDNLVALEAGTKTDNEVTRQCIVSFIGAHALFARDRMRALQFGTNVRSEFADGMTIETTPPTAEDAYGAWWFSLELTHHVAGAAATAVELDAIVTPANRWGQTPSTNSNGLSTPPLVSETLPASGYSAAPLNTGTYSSYRPPTSGGRVFVNGYTRKNGTYVHSYSRRR